jgi:CCR4-NOT transcription complex subunit 3
MERFKACEREMKTKQYSKEGLQAKEKLDPAEVARMEAGSWITSMVDKLSTQVDALEAESELINANKGKRGVKVDVSRLKEVDHWVERHKFHMLKLEHMLRSLENDAISTEDVNYDYYGIAE